MEIPKALVDAQILAEKKIVTRLQDVKWAESSLKRAQDELQQAEKDLSSLNKVISLLVESGYQVEDL